MSDLRKEILRKTAGMPPPNLEFKAPTSKNGVASPQYEVLAWHDFWDSRETSPEGFIVYRTGPASAQPPATNEAESSSANATNTTDVKLKPYLFLLHGAGYSSLSWSLVAADLRSYINIVAYDFRGHGATQTQERDEDFSAETLSTDSFNVITKVIQDDMARLQTTETPKLVIVGHSMGGAIAARTAALIDKSWLKGLILVDIVEGTAMAALPAMHRIIGSRPSSFKSVSDAILWSTKSKIVLNSFSARISVPSQILEAPNATGDGTTWKWRTNLANTEPYWKDWYQGLSKLFLSIGAPKLLLLAGTDRLDQELTIGQMQGKFQMSLLPQAGHVIQEDAPVDTALTILAFLRRQGLVEGQDPKGGARPAFFAPGF